MDKSSKNKSHNWKDKLISSSLPLEFEAAKILVSNKFWITADYTYPREISGVPTDFSVDLKAQAHTPFTNQNKMTASLELLVECKQRSPNIKWLFLPNLNKDDEIYPEYRIGCTLHVVDQFNCKFVHRFSTTEFDENGPFCYKGIEIDESNGSVRDSEIKHGISQLQYAIPRLISQNIDFCEGPFFYCPILLTTSDLMVMNRSVTINDVKDATSLDEIAKKVPYLFFSSDCNSDFEKHCNNMFTQSLKRDLTGLDKYRKDHGEWDVNLPFSVRNFLYKGADKDYFTQFVVCSMDNFPALIRKIKQVTTKAVRKISDHREF